MDLNNVNEHVQSSCNAESLIPVIVMASDCDDATLNDMYTKDESDDALSLNNACSPPKKGRKMKYSMTRQTSKINRNTNLPYIDEKGTLKPAKKFLYDYNCNCPLKCRDVLSVDEGKQEFDRFWNLGSYNAQTMFIASLVGEMPKKRQYGRNTEKRTCTRQYSIANKRVCRQMFVNTLRISPTRVSTALKKKNNLAPLLDQRGNKQGGLKTIYDNKIQEIINQINKVPKYMSHYCRKRTAIFLPSHLSLAKMYDIYRTEVDCPVAFDIYKKIFYKKFNLKFNVPRQETCHACDAFNTKLQGQSDEHHKQLLEIQLDNHHALAKKARDVLKEDLNRAKREKNIECLSYNLQKTLPLPRIPSDVIFYKRQVCLYNLGIFSGKLQKTYCYSWLEGTAGRGAQEVGSCLLKHAENLPNTVEHLILWSDSCRGQNRNMKITLMMAAVLQASANLKTITFKYLVPGHSFLPNEKDFSDIECQLKRHERIYTPIDYVNIVKTCRDKHPIVATTMKKEWFVGTQELEKAIVTRKVGTNKEKIDWLKTRQITLKKEHCYRIFMMPDFNAESICLDIERRGGSNVLDFLELLVQLWPDGKPLSESKLKDVQSYLHLIPDDAKSFYENFRSSADLIEDVDGFNVDELDFKIELEDTN